MKSKISKGRGKVEATGKPIGLQIDVIHALDVAIDQQMAKVKMLQKEREERVVDLMAAMNSENVSSAKGKHALAYISKTRLATVKDWHAVEAFVYKYKAFDLFQRRIMNSAYFDRTEAGEKIPGVDVFERVDLRFKGVKDGTPG
jgi:hypothetical protein